jgi:hypothetical protein
MKRSLFFLSFFLFAVTTHAVPQTTPLCTYTYKVEGSTLWYCTGSEEKNIGTIDPTSFQEVNGFSIVKDKDNVYCEGEKTIADASSFSSWKEEELGLYYKDKNTVFFGCTPIKESDPESFIAIANDFTKDNNHIYYQGTPLDVDRDSFSVFSSGGYAKDKNAIFFRYKKIEGADPESFIILDAKDYTNYCPEKSVEAMDKNAYYFVGEKVCEVTKKEELETYASFPDVTKNHDQKAIKYLKDKEVLEGYANGDFRPDALISRAEFLKILVKTVYPAQHIQDLLDDLKTAHSNYTYLMFKDVPIDAWYVPYLNAAGPGGSNPAIEGYPDGLFHPERTINFVEAAKIIVVCRPDILIETPDSAIWYEKYVRSLAKRGAIPTSITSFDQPITREEMSTMIYRIDAELTGEEAHTYEDIALGKK